MGIAAALIRIMAGLYVRNQNCVHFNLHTRIHVLFCFSPIRRALDVWIVLQIPFPLSLICSVGRLNIFLQQFSSHRGFFSSLFHSFLVE